MFNTGSDNGPFLMLERKNTANSDGSTRVHLPDTIIGIMIINCTYSLGLLTNRSLPSMDRTVLMSQINAIKLWTTIKADELVDYA